MNKKWQIYETNEEEVKKVKSKYQLNELLATILVNRNIIKEDDIRLFLNPTRDDFYDPFLLSDMDKAVKTMWTAIKEKKKVRVIGDYDADGICSSYILEKAIREALKHFKMI